MQSELEKFANLLQAMCARRIKYVQQTVYTNEKASERYKVYVLNTKRAKRTHTIRTHDIFLHIIHVCTRAL